jgi:hypothetical protein
MGFFNRLKSFASSALGSVGGVLSRIGSSGIINKIGNFASQAAPYVGGILETVGAVTGNAMIGAGGIAAKAGLEYIGDHMTSNSKKYDKQLETSGANASSFGKYISGDNG